MNSHVLDYSMRMLKKAKSFVFEKISQKEFFELKYDNVLIKGRVIALEEKALCPWRKYMITPFPKFNKAREAYDFIDGIISRRYETIFEIRNLEGPIFKMDLSGVLKWIINEEDDSPHKKSYENSIIISSLTIQHLLRNGQKNPRLHCFVITDKMIKVLRISLVENREEELELRTDFLPESGFNLTRNKDLRDFSAFLENLYWNCV